MKKSNLFFIGVVLAFLNFQLLTKNCIAQYTKLYDFAPGSSGYSPGGTLISVGTYLYGMTSSGGTNSMGVLFKIKQDGTGYSKLLDFSGVSNGSYPWGSLISDGTFLYGMTYGGGTNGYYGNGYGIGYGTIFKIKPDGTGYSKLHDFAGVSDGSKPSGHFISDGIFLYGMTEEGGIGGFGTMFKIKLDGTGYSKLRDFETVGSNGSSLISDGNFLYGMSGGGTNGGGLIFKIKPDGTGYSVLFDFNGTNGSAPCSSLISDGIYLYGMTQTGGTLSKGVIFKIKPDGTGYSKLLDFGSIINGGINPWSSLTSDGTFLYGMTYGGGTNDYGTMFKIKPDGTGYSKLLDFAGASNGKTPRGSLIYEGSVLYGVTYNGGTNNYGAMFKYAIATSIEESNIGTSFNVYPNPTNRVSTIVLNSNENKNMNIELFDLLGNNMQHFNKQIVTGENNIEIDLSELNSGIYFLRVDNSVQKIQIIK